MDRGKCVTVTTGFEKIKFKNVHFRHSNNANKANRDIGFRNSTRIDSRI